MPDGVDLPLVLGERVLAERGISAVLLTTSIAIMDGYELDRRSPVPGEGTVHGLAGPQKYMSLLPRGLSDVAI